jgi:hypothetical protein
VRRIDELKRFGLRAEDLHHFMRVAGHFHQDFGAVGDTVAEAIENPMAMHDPAFRRAFTAELKRVLAAAPDEDAFARLFAAAGAEDWVGEPRAEFVRWLEREEAGERGPRGQRPPA